MSHGGGPRHHRKMPLKMLNLLLGNSFVLNCNSAIVIALEARNVQPQVVMLKLTFFADGESGMVTFVPVKDERLRPAWL